MAVGIALRKNMIMLFIGIITGEKEGGSQRMIEISKRERFYQQEYCGCVYSLRDSNKWREETGRQKIELVNFIIRQIKLPL